MTDTTTLAPSDAELMQVIKDATKNSAINRDGSTSLRVARAVLAKWGTPPAVAGEPVAIYHGRCTIDCGEHGHLDMELLKMIPAGSKLYTAPQPTQALAMGRVPLSDKAVEQLICTNHFDPKYQLKESDRTVLAWYRLGLRDGERAHGIKQGGAA